MHICLSVGSLVFFILLSRVDVNNILTYTNKTCIVSLRTMRFITCIYGKYMDYYRAYKRTRDKMLDLAIKNKLKVENMGITNFPIHATLTHEDFDLIRKELEREIQNAVYNVINDLCPRAHGPKKIEDLTFTVQKCDMLNSSVVAFVSLMNKDHKVIRSYKVHVCGDIN